MDFKINLIFLIKSFFPDEQNFMIKKYLKNEKSF